MIEKDVVLVLQDEDEDTIERVFLFLENYEGEIPPYDTDEQFISESSSKQSPRYSNFEEYLSYLERILPVKRLPFRVERV